MTLDEIKKIQFVLKANYIKYYKDFSKDDFQNQAVAWELVLRDYSYELVSAGVSIYLATDKTGFPPTSPGQIIDCIQRAIPKKEEMTSMEAWALVRKAICNSLYHSVEEFENLPVLCQKVLGSPEALKEMAGRINGPVEQSHFIRNYEIMQKREQEDKKIPKSVQLLMNDSKMIEGIQ